MSKLKPFPWELNPADIPYVSELIKIAVIYKYTENSK